MKNSDFIIKCMYQVFTQQYQRILSVNQTNVLELRKGEGEYNVLFVIDNVSYFISPDRFGIAWYDEKKNFRYSWLQNSADHFNLSLVSNITIPYTDLIDIRNVANTIDKNYIYEFTLSDKTLEYIRKQK